MNLTDGSCRFIKPVLKSWVYSCTLNWESKSAWGGCSKRLMGLGIKPIWVRITAQPFPSCATLSWALNLFEQEFLQYVKLEEVLSGMCYEIKWAKYKENFQPWRAWSGMMGYALCGEECVKDFELSSGFWGKSTHTPTCAHLHMTPYQSHCRWIEHNLFQPLGMLEPVVCLHLASTQSLWQEHLVFMTLKIPSALSSPEGNKAHKATMFCLGTFLNRDQ